MKIILASDSDYEEKLAGLNRRAAPAREVESVVSEVIEAVRRQGDAALVAYTKRFDGAELAPESLRLEAAVLEGAVAEVSDEIKEAIALSMANVRRFAERSLRHDWKERNAQGAEVGERFQPFQRVGIYVPGGTAPLVSTVVMTVTLAKAAGVPEIAVATPCNARGEVDAALRYALHTSGVTEVYRLGGAQAIAALAYGTATIPPVTKVFGPGNAYVVEAKRQVFGTVAVDLLPGPSEILVLADETANPAFISADLLAQAEHDALSRIVLVTDSQGLLTAVTREIERQKVSLSRRAVVEQVLADGCTLVCTPTFSDAVRVANAFSPEHLSVVCRDEGAWLPELTNAGAIFVGPYSPVAVGDFLAGPSHELPTGGAGKSFAGLTVDQFQRRTSIVRLDRAALEASAPAVAAFCAVEGLDAHARSASIRLS